ncbi:hypothetical protein FKM82_018569, partial [Ascaphus truei]
SQIINATIDNAGPILEIDNVRIEADDFRLKYENELRLRQSIEADTNGLHKVSDELALTKADLEEQIESLTEELADLKKTHEADIQSNQSTTIGQVNVEMDAAPGKDLTKLLNDTRAEYEAIAEKNRRRAEDWFNQKSAEMKQEMSAGVEQVQTSKAEITDSRRIYQSLEMELQSQLVMKNSLEESLAKTEGNYCVQISQIQLSISNMEEQLTWLRKEVDGQKSEYEQLLDIKARLEKEIETYRQLLEGGDSESGKDSGTGSGAAEGTRTGSSSGQASRSGSSISQSSSSQSSRTSTIPSAGSATSSTQSSRSGTLGSGSPGSGGQSSAASGSSGSGSAGSQDQSIDALGSSGSGSTGSGDQSSAASSSSGSGSAGSGGQSSGSPDSSDSGHAGSGGQNSAASDSSGSGSADSGGQSSAASGSSGSRSADSGGQSSGSSGSSGTGHADSGGQSSDEPVKIRKTKTITETLLNGNVVSTKVEETEETMD